MKRTVGYYLFWYMVYGCSFLFPRSRRRYAFGGPEGSFKDNAKYLFIYASEHCKDVDVAWITPYHSTVRRLTSLGLKAYHCRSARGIWHARTSKYWFYNSYATDIGYFFSGGATKVELWHGIGFKCIQYSVKKGVYAQVYRRNGLWHRMTHLHSFSRHDYVLSSAPPATDFFAASFRVPKDRCLELGYPRNGILTVGEDARMAFIRRYEPPEVLELAARLQQYARVLLYMPTWRDNQRRLFVQHLDLERLDGVLRRQGEVMLLKPHPMVYADVDVDEGRYTNLIFLDSMTDVYPLLPQVQVLVTDYSSILYDFLLMEGKEAFLYTYDYEEYVEERDFFYPFDEYVTGNRVTDFEGFLRCVEQHDYAIDPSERQRLLQTVWGETVHYNSSQRIMEFFRGKK